MCITKGITGYIHVDTLGVIKEFAFRLRSVLRAICVEFVLGNCAVCVGFAWGFRSMYCPFTICLIIRYCNSGTLRVRVQGTYCARCCQWFFNYYTNERCSSVTLTVDSPSWFSGFAHAHALLFRVQNFMDHLVSVY